MERIGSLRALMTTQGGDVDKSDGLSVTLPLSHQCDGRTTSGKLRCKMEEQKVMRESEEKAEDGWSGWRVFCSSKQGRHRCLVASGNERNGTAVVRKWRRG